MTKDEITKVLHKVFGNDPEGDKRCLILIQNRMCKDCSMYERCLALGMPWVIEEFDELDTGLDYEFDEVRDND